MNLKRIKNLARANQDCLLILPSGSQLTRFNSDFYYLTNRIDEQHYLLILNDFHCEFSDWESLVGKLKILMGSCQSLAWTFSLEPRLDHWVMQECSYLRFKSQFRLRSSAIVLQDATLLVGKQRLYKEPEELMRLETVSQKSARAHFAIAEVDLVGMTEVEVADLVEVEFKKQGLSEFAYPTIVGSGARALDLHASPSEKLICKGEAVLIDAGGRHENYCADITRTLMGRTPSDEVLQIFGIVKKVQEEIIETIKPGISIAQIDVITKAKLKNELVDLLHFDDFDINQIMYHNTSHWIGLDVHDTSPYRAPLNESISLESSMVLTIEPGLYFGNQLPAAFSKFRGVGVRIEDVIAITEDGNRILTQVKQT